MSLADFEIIEGGGTVEVSTAFNSSEGEAAANLGENTAIVSKETISDKPDPQQIEFSVNRTIDEDFGAKIAALMFFDVETQEGYMVEIDDFGIVIDFSGGDLFTFNEVEYASGGGSLNPETYRRFRVTAYTDRDVVQIITEEKKSDGFVTRTTAAINDPPAVSGGIGLACTSSSAFMDDIVIRY